MIIHPLIEYKHNSIFYPSFDVGTGWSEKFYPYYENGDLIIALKRIQFINIQQNYKL